MSSIPTFCQFCTANHLDNIKNSSRLETENSYLRVWLTLQERLKATVNIVYSGSLWVYEIVAITSRKPPTYTIKDEQDEKILGKFYKRVDHSHLTMESFTIELVSNASAQLFQDNTVNSPKNLFPEQINLEGQWDVVISETSYPLLYQNVTKGKLVFFDENVHSHPNSTVWTPVSSLSLLILLKPFLLSFMKDIITAKALSKLKCLKERKNVKITLQRKDLVLRFLKRTGDTFSVATLPMNFELCREEEDLKKQKLLTKLSAYTPSWYTQTWLSTILLATCRPQCCVVFFPFRNSGLEIL